MSAVSSNFTVCLLLFLLLQPFLSLFSGTSSRSAQLKSGWSTFITPNLFSPSVAFLQKMETWSGLTFPRGVGVLPDRSGRWKRAGLMCKDVQLESTD